MKTITISSPCFNEEDNVEVCYQTVKALFDGPLKGYRREHIFLDNCSEDGTVNILKNIAAQDPAVKVVVNSRNFGIFRSTFNGLKYSTGDATIVLLPVDLQDPPDMIPEFVALWEQGYEVVAGARTNRNEGFWMTRARRLFYTLVHRLSDIEIPINVGEFQLLDRKVMEALISRTDKYPYIRGMIASLGFKRIIVPYTWKARERGKTKHSLPVLFDQAMNGIFSFSRAPMRFCTITGSIIALISILFSILSVAMYFIAPDIAPRGVTTIIVSLFFLSGVQLLFIGVLGEYVTSIHNQVRGGALVIERERINIDTPTTDDDQV